MSAFSPTLFGGKRFAVVGLGKNGLPVALGLRAMGADVVAWDDNPAARQAALETTVGAAPKGADVETAGPLAPTVSPGSLTLARSGAGSICIRCLGAVAGHPASSAEAASGGGTGDRDGGADPFRR